jgi:perosamine synthetase
MAEPTLAIDGGPKAVTASAGDSWLKVGPLEKEYVNRVMDDFGSAYDEIDKFEEEFRDAVDTKYALAMCNGTATVHSAIFAAGARQGREVIVPSVTWHASISPILHCGATPVFCDVDPDTYCADPADVRSRITPETCAIVVTHTYGNPADMDGFLDIVDGTDIKLIEDASHAHGATWDGRQVGSLGDIGCFSLQASKAVSGIEAGVATTNDPALYDRMLALGHYGRVEKLAQTGEFADLHNMGLA